LIKIDTKHLDDWRK